MFTNPDALLSMARQHHDDLARQARLDRQVGDAVQRRRQRAAAAKAK